MKKILLLALLLCGMSVRQFAAVDPSKIVVVSDPHVMSPQLLVNEGTAWETYLAGQRKLVDFSKQLFDEMISRIETIEPGLVLITGDLTKDGEQLSHQYVISKLDELKDLGIKTLVIPGNHDRGTNNDAVSYDGDGTSPADVADNEWFAEKYASYGYGTTSERESTTLTYSCEPIKGLVVIGIDSGTGGPVSTTTLNWVCEKAAEAYSTGKQVIAMMHHPLIPHFTGVDKFVETAAVNNYETVRNALANAGIKVIFTGHFHTSDIAKDWNKDMSKEIYDVNTGSLVSYPCDYRVVTLSNNLSDLSITTEHISELTSGDGFANTAKTRLKAAVKKQIEAQGSSYSLISEQASDAFIIHAEGNEPNNPTSAELLSTFESMANLGVSLKVLNQDQAETLKAMAYSMLQDKSNYGTKREDVTNDLELTMVTMAASGFATYCSDKRLDFSSVSDLAAYIATDVTASAVTLKSVGVVPANTGIVLHGTASTSYEVDVTDAAADDVSANILIGTLTETAAPENAYALATQNGTTGFYPVKKDLAIPAHKAYLVNGSSVRCLSLGDDFTGINNISAEERSSDIVYDLQGRRVHHLGKGLYLINGKKLIIK